MFLRCLAVSVLAAALWVGILSYVSGSVTTDLNAAEHQQAQLLAQRESPQFKGKAGFQGKKLLNIVFQKAFLVGLVGFGNESFSAEGSGNLWTIEFYDRKDGVPYRMSIDWLTQEIPEHELDQMVGGQLGKSSSLRINGFERTAEITRFGKSTVRTTFDVHDSWPLKIEFWMRPPPPLPPIKGIDVGGEVSKSGDRKKVEKADTTLVKKQAPKLPKQEPSGAKPAAPERRAQPETSSDYKYKSTLIQIAANRFDFFERNLYPTFKHARCTTCHLMGSTEAIFNQHHSDNVAGPIDNLKPDDPVGCGNCHGDVRAAKEINSATPANFLGQLGNFTDYTWRSPSFSKNINWKAKVDARDVCTTVISHLGTKDKLNKHFHNDARLAWAVSAGDIYFGVPGGQFGTKESAPPGSFTKFLQRVDTWLAIGFPCKQ